MQDVGYSKKRTHNPFPEARKGLSRRVRTWVLEFLTAGGAPNNTRDLQGSCQDLHQESSSASRNFFFEVSGRSACSPDYMRPTHFLAREIFRFIFGEASAVQ